MTENFQSVIKFLILGGFFLPELLAVFGLTLDRNNDWIPGAYLLRYMPELKDINNIKPPSYFEKLGFFYGINLILGFAIAVTPLKDLGLQNKYLGYLFIVSWSFALAPLLLAWTVLLALFLRITLMWALCQMPGNIFSITSLMSAKAIRAANRLFSHVVPSLNRQQDGGTS